MAQDPASSTDILLPLITGYTNAQVVHVAVQLGLADLLANGPRTIEELATTTGTHAPSLARLIRALAALGIVAEADGAYIALTALGTRLRADAPDSVRPAVLFLVGAWSWRAWGTCSTACAPGSQRSTASSG